MQLFSAGEFLNIIGDFSSVRQMFVSVLVLMLYFYNSRVYRGRSLQCRVVHEALLVLV